jgi:hypothetical protein
MVNEQEHPEPNPPSFAASGTYFDDKIKYRGENSTNRTIPPALSKLEILLGDLTKREGATRKGNVIRNWLMDYSAFRPLQHHGLGTWSEGANEIVRVPLMCRRVWQAWST